MKARRNARPKGPNAQRNVGLPLELLWQAAETSAAAGVRGGNLPQPLAARFRGELAIPLRPDRPTVIANFVSSLDGVVSLGAGVAGSGGEISGYSEADRFMMSLLRGLADAIVVGAGTVRAGSRHEWTSRRLQPGLAAEFAGWRAALGLAAQPTTVLVTARGEIDPAHPGLNAIDVPVVLATTGDGARRLSELALPPHVKIAACGSGNRVGPAELVGLLRDLGARLALCEGGPHLFSGLLEAGLVDELFLTLAPQLVGRGSDSRRLGLVQGVAFADGQGRWARLQSIRRAGDDIFTRYRFEG
jgi:riboflavin biosynthesis pyrimidine reductase